MTPAIEVPDPVAQTGGASAAASSRPPVGLTPAEELILQQLQQAKYWADKCSDDRQVSSEKAAPNSKESKALPETWSLTRGFVLHDWQEECVRKWADAGKRGVIKVVTGAGKTVLALAIAERLQQTERPSLRVAIVVPTIVLLNQWRDELAEHGNLPASSIALMGGGHDGRFGEGTRILICVLNSAAKKLPELARQAGVADDLLLIVDECHRAGASEMKQVFATKRAYSLGLSATPERTDDPSAETQDDEPSPSDEPAVSFEESVLGQELGPVVFELNYADAIRRGVLPPFQIVHYGLSLAPKEREKYEGLSRKIKDLRQELETSTRRGLALIRWCRSSAGAKNPRAVQLLSATTERKRLLYRVEERFRAVLHILGRAFGRKPDTKAILFHESIDEVMNLFALLREAGYAVVAEHSGFPDAMRAESLRLFRQGAARVIVSARSLIEGFNVPSADLGIIIAASSSIRQRVQTLGRLLRRNRDQGGEKQATLFVLYAAETVDELIYEKADWERFVGADRNDYNRWNAVATEEPKRQSGPPRRPPVNETEVDAVALLPGGVYPGNPDQGQGYSVDTQGTVRDEQGAIMRPHEQLRSLLGVHLKGAGRFRVTPLNRFVIRLDRAPSGWQAVFLGRIDEPLVPAEHRLENVGTEYKPGDPYPLGAAKGNVFSVLQRDRRLIARKQRGKAEFVVAAEELLDSQKRIALRQIQEFLATAYARGHQMNKITVTNAGHVVYVHDSQAYFVGQAPEGAEGFIFESNQDATG